MTGHLKRYGTICMGVCRSAHLIGRQLVGQVRDQLLALDIAAAILVYLLKCSPRMLLPQILVPPLSPPIMRRCHYGWGYEQGET